MTGGEGLRRRGRPGAGRGVARGVLPPGGGAGRRSPPACLKLEIPESAKLDEADLEAVFSELQGLGVRFLVDDFGTGYSSLGHFKRFGISGLKLDRSLIRDLGFRCNGDASC